MREYDFREGHSLFALRQRPVLHDESLANNDTCAGDRCSDERLECLIAEGVAADTAQVNSSPRAVRSTTPRCSLLEPGEISACVTAPVILRLCVCISPSDVFCNLDHAIVLGVRDEDAGLPLAGH
jgi:hypothetical protein